MIKTLILPIILLITLITFSCALPSANTEGELEVTESTQALITGTLSYRNLNTFANAAVKINPRLAINPAAAESSLRYAMTIVSGSLPDGLTFYPDTGAIEGTPTKAGNDVIRITATAASKLYAGTVESDPFTIKVRVPITGTLSYADFYGARDAAIPPHSPLSPVFNVNPPEAESSLRYAMTIVSGSLPDGLTFYPDTGAIEGTPTEEGSPKLKVVATANGDYVGRMESNEFTVRIVFLANIEGTFRYQSIAEGLTGVFVRIPFSQNSITPWATVRYEKQNEFPAGLSINSGTGFVEGIPLGTTTGEFTRQVKVFGTGLYRGTIYSNEFRIKIVSEPIQIGGTLNYRLRMLTGVRSLPVSFDAFRTEDTITPSGAKIRYEKRHDLPAGLFVNPDTGSISGTPLETTTGRFTRQIKAIGIGIYTGEVLSDEFKIKIVEPVNLNGTISYDGGNDLIQFSNGVFSFVPELTGTLVDATREGMVEFEIVEYDDATGYIIDDLVLGVGEFEDVYFSPSNGAISRRDIGRSISNAVRFFGRFRISATGKGRYIGSTDSTEIRLIQIIYD